MKNYFFLLALMFLGHAYAQESIKNQELYDTACNCIEEIDSSASQDERYEEVSTCLKSAIMAEQLKSKLLFNKDFAIDSLINNTKDKDSVTVKKNININLDPTEGYEDLERELLDNCNALKKLMIDDVKSSKHSMSDDEAAKIYYKKGLDAYSEGKFPQALDLFERAVDADRKFAFAWDMIGITHRQMGDFKQAVKNYKKSLRIDPKGKMPLQNLPVAYRLLEEYEKALEVYEDLIKYYPDDAEGYYGIGQTAGALGKFAMAADNMMIAYNMYVESNSPYSQDAIRMLKSLYVEMQNRDQLEEFLALAEKHNIKFQETSEEKE
ncbi:tetratricopeptide repeat protein [Nonlabens xiamenensis]|uniref:tetratricopeptide repeat protein n=1 Tax=Nonlabens xiamenensis TaxID=2341043 RepID=UPI000F60D2C3|nr:tetratricopeptide repeat protein [Nonlabens xiamenensis]